MRSQTVTRWTLSVVLAVIMLGMWLLALNQTPISQSHSLATDYTVGGVCGSTIQACINNPIVQAGDQILIPAGIYTESLTLDKPVSLIGTEAETTVIRATSNQRVMTVTGSLITATTVISGLTFTGGQLAGASYGGGVFLINGSAPLIQNTIIMSNSSANGGGGGIFAESGLLLVNVQVLSNTALTGGGMYAYGPVSLLGGRFEGNRSEETFPGGGDGGGLFAVNTLTLTGTEFVNNTAGEAGGGAYVNGLAVLTDGRFVNNNVIGSSSVAGGGAIKAAVLQVTDTEFISNTSTVDCGAASAGSAIVNGSRFESNQAIGQGGGLCVGPLVDAALLLSNTDFLSNTSHYGGAVYASRVTINGGHFEGNSAAAGGAIAGVGSIAITNTEFINNLASSGSGSISAGTAILINARFVRNQASNGAGGGIGTFGALTAMNTDFISNTASTTGGGAYAGGTLTLIGGSFESNQTTNSSYGAGGGAHAAGTLMVTGTQFLNNMTANNGGALSIAGGGRIVNALFAGNKAGKAGAAVYVSSYPQDLTILHTSIVDTGRNPKQGIFVYLGNVGITDTIITSHTIGIDNFNLSGTSASYQDYNLFFGNTQNLSGTISGGSHNQNGDPLFVDPLNSDYHLKAGSAAIDNGIFVSVLTDLDGHSRLTDYGGLRVDIGAYEYHFQGIIYNIYLPLVLRSN